MTRIVSQARCLRQPRASRCANFRHGAGHVAPWSPGLDAAAPTRPPRTALLAIAALLAMLLIDPPAIADSEGVERPGRPRHRPSAVRRSRGSVSAEPGGRATPGACRIASGRGSRGCCSHPPACTCRSTATTSAAAARSPPLPGLRRDTCAAAARMTGPPTRPAATCCGGQRPWAWGTSSLSPTPPRRRSRRTAAAAVAAFARIAWRSTPPTLLASSRTCRRTGRRLPWCLR